MTKWINRRRALFAMITGMALLIGCTGPGSICGPDADKDLRMRQAQE